MAHPETWVAARYVAVTTANLLAARSEWLSAGRSDIVETAEGAFRNASAALAAADDAHPHRDGGWVGPKSEAERAEWRALASSRNEWEGIDLAVGSGGIIRHTTGSGRTSWMVDTDGTTVIERFTNDRRDGAPTALAATVLPSGSVSVETTPRTTLRDLQRLAECLVALGSEREARRCLLLANPADLALELGELERRRDEATQRPDPSRAGYPPEYWELHAAPIGAALDTLRALAMARESERASIRESYLSA